MENQTTLTKNTVKNIIGQKLEKIQDIKKHECPYCGQKFVKKQFLSSHLQIRHVKLHVYEVRDWEFVDCDLTIEYGEDCIEAQTVLSFGGKMHFVDRIDSLSTTAIIEKIQKSKK